MVPFASLIRSNSPFVASTDGQFWSLFHRSTALSLARSYTKVPRSGFLVIARYRLIQFSIPAGTGAISANTGPVGLLFHALIARAGIADWFFPVGFHAWFARAVMMLPFVPQPVPTF